MDPGSILGVLGQLLGFADRASSTCEFICSVVRAPEDMQMLKNDIANHLALFQSVTRLVKSNEELATYFTAGPIETAMQVIKELLDLIGGDSTDHLPSMVSTWKNIKWSLKKKELREIRQKLECQKTSIQASLTTALGHIVLISAQNHTRTGDAILEGVIRLNDTLDIVERRGIVDSCLPQNDEIPALHRNRKDQQEPETCDWISREESFRGWLKPRHSFGDTTRFVWICGIPGSGKTVLAASIIERAANSCRSCGYAYYYCLYSRKQDETIPFLKFVLRLLCKQKQNMVLPRLEEANAREEALSVDDLLNCLEAVSHAYENGVHIIVDAVDESKPRENLIKVLRQIGTDERFWKVSLLFTSREENDIMEPMALLGNAVARISMSNKNVRDDIKRYIHAQLISTPFFRKYYGDSLIDEVESVLTRRAKGMFRWAVCQLDVLKRTRDRESVERALATLPGDIFATYERILTEIPQPDQEFARTALALICSYKAKIPTAEVLVEASLWSVPFNDIGRYTWETLKESCGSLISLTNLNRVPPSLFTRGNEAAASFHRCNLAHYTVKEYLFSPSVANGAAQFFALSDQVVGNIDLKVIFAGLGHFGLFNNNRRQAVLSRYEEYCLEMTDYALVHRRADIIRDEAIRKIVIKSLTPGSPHFVYLNDLRGISRIMKESFQRWHMLCSLDPALRHHKPSGLLVNLAALGWRDLAVKYLESAEFKDLSKQEKRQIWTATFTLRKTETVLGFCLRECKLNFLRVFVRHGASFDYEPEALYTAMKVFEKNPDKALEALKFLLSAGAHPNPVPSQDVGAGFAFTPLQLAISELAYDWVELLLEEGADVNRLATPDGVIPSIFDDINPKGDEAMALRDISQQTALEICSYTQPSWIQDDRSDENRIRESIIELLKRHGAEESRGETEDESMTDIGVQNPNRGDPETIDLTMMAFDDATGHQIS
ncbi:hypothetical protein F4801DRAFT_605499 [Xylaria longipes]|nr:hypothetical protein F4801DRAFT_605499 [Xylaria longipes]